MERQKTLLDKVVESEAVFEEKELAEAEFLWENEEPADIADRLYEEWRDEQTNRNETKIDASKRTSHGEAIED